MSKRTLGIVLMVGGVLVVIVALGADALGIGAKAGLGWKQALGAVVGVIIVAVGAGYWPGFPRSPRSLPSGTSRTMGQASAPAPAAPRATQKSESPEGRRKPGTAKSSAQSVRKGTSRGSR